MQHNCKQKPSLLNNQLDPFGKILKLGKHKSRIVEDDYGCADSNTWILEYLATIRHGTEPRI